MGNNEKAANLSLVQAASSTIEASYLFQSRVFLEDPFWSIVAENMLPIAFHGSKAGQALIFWSLFTCPPSVCITQEVYLSGADNGTVLLPGNEDGKEIMPSLPL